MSKSKLLHIRGYLTLAHFAVCDIITGLITFVELPWSILLQKPIFPKVFPAGLILTYGVFSRKTFMVFMAGVTFWSVVFPLSARQYMPLHWYRKALTLIWLTSCLISIPYWIGNGHYSDFKNYRWSLNTANFAPKYGLATNIIVTVVILLVYQFCVWKLLKRRSISHHRENNLILTRSYIMMTDNVICYQFGYFCSILDSYLHLRVI